MKAVTKKRKMLWIALAVFCVILAFACAAAADGYYPGPEPKEEEPVVVATPKAEPPAVRPHHPPVPKDTQNPTKKTRPKPTPKPTQPPEIVPDYDPPAEPEPPETYDVTVYYRYSDGTEAAVPYKNHYQDGESFGVHSPNISGYHTTTGKVSGKVNGRNESIVVYYYKDSDIILEDYGTPLGLGDIIINIGDCYE